jgi:hypothetical protein
MLLVVREGHETRRGGEFWILHDCK